MRGSPFALSMQCLGTHKITRVAASNREVRERGQNLEEGHDASDELAAAFRSEAALQRRATGALLRTQRLPPHLR